MAGNWQGTNSGHGVQLKVHEGGSPSNLVRVKKANPRQAFLERCSMVAMQRIAALADQGLGISIRFGVEVANDHVRHNVYLRDGDAFFDVDLFFCLDPETPVRVLGAMTAFKESTCPEEAVEVMLPEINGQYIEIPCGYRSVDFSKGNVYGVIVGDGETADKEKMIGAAGKIFEVL